MHHYLKENKDKLKVKYPSDEKQKLTKIDCFY